MQVCGRQSSEELYYNHKSYQQLFLNFTRKVIWYSRPQIWASKLVGFSWVRKTTSWELIWHLDRSHEGTYPNLQSREHGRSTSDQDL